ncbi:LysR family transcriptional regulator [uncultured Roseobacter sp.]|uniref:LysR family transcriptional regulator n=1 Tax=uncultured Roseobacter sp. TaxID=114847 RepID=UPI00260B4B2D|nr:LysR family transcriptional regulator [uncultured Roseobacter sp.]
MKLDPRHLAQLSVIVETGAFQAAADRLSLSQPALSRNIRTLEDRLGAPLFDRDGRRSVPNELGRKLARSGLSIRIAEEQAGQFASLAQTGSAGQLRIGAPPIVSGRFLTDTLSGFVATHPECRVEIRTGLVHALRSMLERGQIDIVFGPQGANAPGAGLNFLPLIDDRVAILCRRDHPLTRAQVITARDLETQQWLAHSRGSLLRQQTEAAMVASGVQDTQIVCETDSIRAALEIVAATDLISTMPVETTRPYLEERLVFLEFDHPQFHRPLGAIQRSNTPANPLVEAFLAALQARLAGADG